jgi:hypothetical protein
LAKARRESGMFGGKVPKEQRVERTGGRYKVESITGLRRAMGGVGEIEKHLNEGAAKGWKLVETIVADQQIYLVFDTGSK